MSRLHRSLPFLLAFLAIAPIATTRLPLAPGLVQEPETAADSGDAETDPGWPRVVESGDLTLTVYQPQIEKFDPRTLEARAAVAVESKGSKEPSYGVIWIHADVDVDKEQGLVTLTNIQITRASFPGAPDRQEEFLQILRENAEATRTISLARIEANLAITQSEKVLRRAQVKNDPPRVFYSSSPAILVLIDGQPVLRPLPGSSLQRVVNTRALLLFDPSEKRWWLTIMGRWFGAPDVEGAWTLDPRPPAEAEELRRRIASSEDLQADLLEDPGDEVKKAIELGIAPKIFVGTGPAELIVTQGKPQMQPIPGTQLVWVQNSKNKIFLDVDDQRFYVQLSGRWYRSRSLSGPWQFVESDRLPADFAKIPEKHPAGSVLASVAGTPQAKEAAIADEIPQTAQIDRRETTIKPQYDGEPRFEDIEGTSLAYAKNSPTPVIRVDADLYFAVDDGVWYTAPVPFGPWAVATAVPPVIYTIPISCPIYYVTYVRVFGFTDDFVWAGYTPGYLGSCLAPWGTVVYGSGWYYPPWIGSVWIGAPWTWGFGVAVEWDWSFGWAVTFARPYWRPWWGPVGWGWGRQRPVVPAAWRPGQPLRLNRVNVYRALPARAVVTQPAGRRVATFARPQTRPGVPPAPRSVVRPRAGAAPPARDVYAGRDGNVYRPSRGQWEHNDGNGWRRLPPEPRAPSARPAPPVRQPVPEPRVQAAPVPRPSIPELTQERRARESGGMRSAPRPAPAAPPRAAPPPKRPEKR